MLQEDIINIFESKNLQFLGKILQSGFISLVDHNFHHLLTNQLLLWSFGVASSSNLLGGSLCEANAKHSNEVSIACFGLHKCLNEGVPLLDESAQLVSCDVHSVEVGVAIKALDFFDLQLHLSPGLIIAISVQISQRYFKDTSFQTISSDLYKRGYLRNVRLLTLSSSSVARSDCGLSHIENSGCKYVVPFLLGERMSAIW